MPRPPPLTADEVARERRMLKELKIMQKHELALSTLSKKRVREPKVDEDNPFCTDRQLQDEISLRNFNKNPQLHTTKLSPFATPRTQNPHNHTDIHLPPERLPHVQINKEQNSASLAVNFPAYNASMTIATQRHPSRSKASPSTQHSLKKPVTFGHRPTSASRHFNPVTSELNASAAFHNKLPRKQARGVAIGMSADRLKALLNSPPPQSHSTAESNPSTTPDKADHTHTGNSWKAQCNEDDTLTNLAVLEKGFNTRQYTAPKLKKESILNTPPTDSSVGDILAKFRKLAVGLN
ncbi:hypothetical protein H257_05609 [Aphanomyces astaci]|uniref:Uncharacterized protein n=1 Tax=Aphanomyces astaci TaxID=112090 RepID=W4GT05_APHAT|nr:hypothetical protein H257_05609 [Aphanomyces astaci]ETV82099.1 hypothetical protein H257_05609 [Aphanomyces astaci]|eukprot:XP_009828836.1 hypothetical protein H257_05609 [Aphanomyces astaci]